jgi:hypothetical protein
VKSDRIAKPESILRTVGILKKDHWLYKELLLQGVELAELDPQESRDVDRRWLDGFAWRVQQEKGVSIYGGYRWHGFSYHLQPCLEGGPALEAYLRQDNTSFYVFTESMDYCALCHSETYPDLSTLRQDIYVAHRNMKWTMAFTHEQPHIGPFFAERHLIRP